MFKLEEQPNGESLIVFEDSNGKIWGVPKDPANSDYQAYLTWLEEQA